jgi:hypothetical protein
VLLRLPAKSPKAAKPVAPDRPPKPLKSAPPKEPPPDDDDVIEEVEVVRRPRKVRKKRRPSRKSGSFEMPEWLLPLGLFAFAALTNVMLALRNGGDEGHALLVFSLINLAVAVPVTIGGMFVAAAALGINFGGIFTAILKVAAIVTVVQCIYTVGMTGGGDGSGAIVLLLAAPVYWGMFCWLFDLTFVEALQATFLIGLIQKGVNVVLTLVAAGIFLKATGAAP